MFDYVIVTHLPAFYKTNLYNELSKKLRIFVIFVASQSSQRTKDFVNLNCLFDYMILNEGNFEDRNPFQSILKLRKVIKKLKFKKLLVNGWDLSEFWWLIFTNKKEKNGLVLESTIFESKANGLKGFIKSFFLSRISTVFASGKLHVDLLKKMNFSGEMKITRGVGIINKVERQFSRVEKKYQKRFLFLGRLAPEKNLKMLVSVFNDLPTHCLSIVGSGPLKLELKAFANDNIRFLDHIENQQLQEVFNNHDFLILPSLQEPWGLVVEEALYFGVPVMVSKNCGASELIKNGVNGFIFDPDGAKDVKGVISNITPTLFKKMVTNFECSALFEKDQLQVSVYE